MSIGRNDPSVNVVITVDGKQYTAAMKQAGAETVDFGKKTDTSAASLFQLGGLVKMAGAAFAGWQLSKLITDIVQTNATFEKLEASLKTVTGSQLAAGNALDMITKMAADTPFSVQQLTESFIKLKALGLDPSEASLISYGNTASAMGKDLNQMIEAVADASTGEFERLKEFGIRANVEGDKVKFTFQGVTTQIGNNSAEIQKYLMDIGENQFAGAMTEQMDTLDGKFSNLSDATDRLMVALGDAGLTSTTKTLTGALTALVSKAAEFVDIYAEFEEDPFSDRVVAIRDYSEEVDALTRNLVAQLTLLDRAIERGADQNTVTMLTGNVDGLTERINALKEAIATLKSGVAAEREAAAATSNNAPAAAGPAAGDGFDSHMGLYEQNQARAAQSLADLEQSLMTEEERLLDSWIRREQIVEDSYARGQISKQQHDEMMLQLEEQYQVSLSEKVRRENERRARLEERIQNQITSMRFAAAQQAIGLFKMVAGESKAAAIAAIAMEKALAIAQVMINTEVAASAALATPPYGLGPVAGAPLAAQVRMWGKVSMGLIAATGLAEAANAGSGGAGSGGGSYGGGYAPPPAPPNVPNGGVVGGGSGGTSVFNIEGRDSDTISVAQAQQMMEHMRDAFERGDEVIIRRGSRQALELGATG